METCPVELFSDAARVHVKMKIQTPIDPKVYTQEEALALLEKTVKKEIKN